MLSVSVCACCLSRKNEVSVCDDAAVSVAATGIGVGNAAPTGNDDAVAADSNNKNNNSSNDDGVGLPVRKVGHIFFLPYRRLPKGHTHAHTTCAHTHTHADCASERASERLTRSLRLACTRRSQAKLNERATLSCCCRSAGGVNQQRRRRRQRCRRCRRRRQRERVVDVVVESLRRCRCRTPSPNRNETKRKKSWVLEFFCSCSSLVFSSVRF